jgi:hypothetical protein
MSSHRMLMRSPIQRHFACEIEVVFELENVATITQMHIPSSNDLAKGVAFFLSRGIELAHHARFFRKFFGRTMEEKKNTTFEKSCDGSAKQLSIQPHVKHA